MMVMLPLSYLVAMTNVATSCPVELVVVVVSNVEGLDRQLVEAGSVNQVLGTTVEVTRELAVVKHGQHAIRKLNHDFFLYRGSLHGLTVVPSVASPLMLEASRARGKPFVTWWHAHFMMGLVWFFLSVFFVLGMEEHLS